MLLELRITVCVRDEGLLVSGPKGLAGFVSGAWAGDSDDWLFLEGAGGDEELCERGNRVLAVEAGSKNASGVRCGGGCEQQVDGFFAGEEVSFGVGVGDRHLFACADLAEKSFADAAFGAQDVSEPQDDAAVGDCDLFGDALGGAEDADGRDGFVGGKEHDARDVESSCTFDQIECAERVVGDCCQRVFFEQWYVFVCCGVEDELGAVGFEDFSEMSLIENVGENDGAIRRQMGIR